MADPTQGDIRKVLGSHGHGFQYALLRLIADLGTDAAWFFQVAEFPVGSGPNATHIDFVLKARDEARIYLVAECKRADPARASWCFVKAPYTRGGAAANEIVFQAVCARPVNIAYGVPITSGTLDNLCHLGFELRTGQTGDGFSTGPMIKEATAQVLRGMNGLADQMFKRGSIRVEQEGYTMFLPVIFTTASLYVVDGDLGAADVLNGKLPDGWGEVKNVDWLWLNQSQSPDLLHSLQAPSSGFDLPGILYAEYNRSIAIVSAGGAKKFLKNVLLAQWLSTTIHGL